MKQGGAKKRPRTPKVSPGEIFEQRSKLVVLQNSEEYATNRSFIQLDIDSVQQTDHTVTYEIESNNNTSLKILTSSYTNKIMVTSPDSPPVPNNHEKIRNNANESIHFVSSKSTRKTDKAVKKMQALKEDTPNYNNPQVDFLDPDNNEQDIQAQIKAIQREEQRLEMEQANLISITPAPQHTPQDELTKTHSSEKTANQKTDDTNNTTVNNNTNDTHEPITQDANTKKHERQ